ncbi:MAG: cryptochrome/photolyase family protein [Alphaproteobacteria bacterium]|nr:cryptochrome/photolyase family protein [Alphaproteobacteria bacterium]
MAVLRVILGDQLSDSISSLEGCDKSQDTILMCEVMEEASYVKHHKKKIAFLFSAMRHFAQELNNQGYKVRYIKLDDPNNTGTFIGEINRAVKECACSRVVVTEPGEYRVLQLLQSLNDAMSAPVELRVDNRFLSTIEHFKKWADGKKQLRMEFFYRDMRKKYNILMDDEGKPIGGEWNYDKENRKSPPIHGLNIPKRISHKKSEITIDVLSLVAKKFDNHFGDLEPFHFAVTRTQALIELEHFIKTVLPNFGDYQDAMVMGEPYLYHSLLSAYLNAGLLLPLEVCQAAQAAFHNGKVPLNAAEGFIRQILGWREYVRGIYWLHMPQYASLNYFKADKHLPDFYWTAKTDMVCVAEAVRHTQDHAYSHHIQRLMVTGNFAMLAGIAPAEVCEWYLAVYADAYEWVELPNTLGMALYGDGGIMASKPYAASGKYINRMSNYCSTCKYDPEVTVGENACPFNALYWDFLIRNEKQLRGNQRMPYVFATWDKMADDKKQAIREQARLTLSKIWK